MGSANISNFRKCFQLVREEVRDHSCTHSEEHSRAWSPAHAVGPGWQPWLSNVYWKKACQTPAFFFIFFMFLKYLIW